MKREPELVVGRWYRFKTAPAYETLTRIGELVEIAEDTLHGHRCRMRGRGQGPVYVVPEKQVIAEVRVEDVL